MTQSRGSAAVRPADRGVRLELWAHPGMVARGELDGIIAGMRRLERTGVVDAVRVETWDRFVDLSPDADPPTRRARRRYATFANWAGVHREAVPAGDAARVGVGRMGPPHRVRRTPRALLAEFRDGVVVRVAPCESTETIRQRLAELESLADAGVPGGPASGRAGGGNATSAARPPGGRRPERRAGRPPGFRRQYTAL